MNLIDNTYFINEINLPLSSNASLNSRITASIAKYEPELLRKLLGYKLYKEFADALIADAATGGSHVDLPQKWVDFRDGKEFTFEFGGVTVTEKWEGLINAEKSSIIANYVYFQHRYYNDVNTTAIGDVIAKSENADRVSPIVKLVDVWNMMVDKYGHIPTLLMKRLSFNDSSVYVHWDNAPSAYNFLLANIADYEGWVFEPLGKLNTFGL